MSDELACLNSISLSDLDRDTVASTESPRILAGPVDAALLFGEWAFRQVYWRSALLRKTIHRARGCRKPDVQVANKIELEDHLRSIGVCEGALVMAHTSVTGVCLNAQATAPVEPPNPLKVAQELVSLLIGLVGKSGTLAMSTQPAYKRTSNESKYRLDQRVYDPRSTPCGIGLANEIFRRYPGTRRSHLPQNPLAVRGPLADELISENLTSSKPLPHGLQSSYYRFVAKNGLVISVGVPLLDCLTLTHVAEEIRDEQWLVRDFFADENYLLRDNGQERIVTIRQTRSEFMKFGFCRQKYRRDLLRAGILHENHVGTIRVDWAHSAEVIRFICDRNSSSAYPFFGTSFVPRTGCRHAA